MGDYDNAVAKLGQWDRQDSLRRSNEIAERMVCKLKPGDNYFTPDQYRAIVSYLYPNDQEKERDQAIRDGSFSPPLDTGLRRINIVRVKWLTEDRLVTLTDLSKKTGIPRKTLSDRIRQYKLVRQYRGKKVLYDIDALRERLKDIPE